MTKPTRPRVVHTYRNACVTVRQPPGLADFLRGTMALHQYSTDLGFELRVDFSHHGLNHFVEGDALTYVDGEVHEFFNENQGRLAPFLSDLRAGETYLVTTHNFPTRPIEQDCRDFIKQVFRPRERVTRRVSALVADRGLAHGYSVLHIRTGDLNATFENQGFDDANGERCVDAIVGLVSPFLVSEILPRWKRASFVISDNEHVARRLATECDLGTVPGEPVHLGWRAHPNGIEQTLVAFFLMAGSTTIYQWSIYGGSGFSEIAASIYGQPLVKGKT